MKIKLKPCPFCGGKVGISAGVAGLEFVTCLNFKDCGAIVSFDNPKANMQKSITGLWNTRKEEKNG